MDLTPYLQYLLPAALIVYVNSCAISVMGLTQIIINTLYSLGVGYIPNAIKVFLSLISSAIIVYFTALKLRPEIYITPEQLVLMIFVVWGIANGIFKVTKRLINNL